MMMMMMIIKGGHNQPDTTKNTGAGFMKEAEEVDPGTDPGKDPSADSDDTRTKDLETTLRVPELQKKVFAMT